MSEDEENDDWYDQMVEYAAYAYDDEPTVDSLYQVARSVNEQDIDEMSYFQQIQDVNTTISEQSFKTEDNYIWQSFARQLVQDKLLVGNVTNKAWLEVNIDEYSTTMILQQWLFSHIPYTFKLYNTIASGSIYYQKQFRFFVDDKLHPSTICMTRYFEANKEIECCIFNPYRDSRPESLQLAGVNTEYFEVYFPAFPLCKVDWVEYCHTYTLQTSIQALLMIDLRLPEGYHFESLSTEDADLVNDTWKYKSEESIHMVRRMIDTKRCMGIRTNENELVCWCLSYEYGAIGMLYTLPEHRGKSLAKQVVHKLITILIQDFHIPTSPFCYIEQSNDISKHIFQQLGFGKCDEIVWAGLQFAH